jgi:7-carboxy-7-deazaguanine synthase
MTEAIPYTIHSSEVKAGLVLPVMESFYTIQGEGFHQGKAAYFIRLAGCDVGCHWCDVKESWPADAHPFLNIDTIVGEVRATKAPLVVITGGEPLMYNIEPLVASLQSSGLLVHTQFLVNSTGYAFLLRSLRSHLLSFIQKRMSLK